MGLRGTGWVCIDAHETRSALASIIGCARTVADAGEGLDPETRGELLSVVVSQAFRLDWMVRAAAAAFLDDESIEGVMDAGVLVRDALAFAGVEATYEADGSFDVLGDERRLRLGIEALVLSLRPEQEDGAGVSATCTGEGFTIRVPAVDLKHPDREWKLALAHRLLREQEWSVVIRVDGHGIEAQVSLRSPQPVPVTA